MDDLVKVSVGHLDGHIGEGEICYGSSGALPRAKLAAEIIRRRFEIVGLALRDVRFDFIGVDSLFGAAGRYVDEKVARPDIYRDVRLRVSGRAGTENEARVIGREVEALYTNGPAGGGSARSCTRKILSIASILVPDSDVIEVVNCFDL